MTMSLIIRVCLLTFLLMASHSACEASEKKPLKLTLDHALQIALDRNQDLAAARLEVKGADARVNEAWGTALPTVDFVGRYARAIRRPVFFLPDFEDLGSGRTVPIEVGSNHAVDLTFTTTQVLFNTAVITGVGAARIYSRAARELYRARVLETIARVKKAYYTVLLAREVQNLMRDNLKNAEEHYANVRLLSALGIVSEYDELRAEVGVENLRPLAIQSENNYALSLDALRAAMGVGIEEEIEVVDALAFQPLDKEMLANAPEIVVETNAYLRGMRHQLDVNRALVNIERSDYLPTLTAFGNYQYQAAKNDLRISTNDFVRSSLVGLHLSFNLFRGFQTNARVQQAKLEARKSEEQYASLETAIRTSVHSTLLRIREAQERVNAQGRTVEQAERGYRIATTRYLNGAGTQLEVNDAQLALTQARVNRIQAVYDYLTAAAELEQLVGHMPEFVSGIE